LKKERETQAKNGGQIPIILKMGVRFQLIWRDFSQRVIQDFSKTLNLCIMKTAASPVPADNPLKTRHFEAAPKHPSLNN
jgi:hypothetical protein